MSFPPLQPPSQNSIASSAPKLPTTGSARSRQPAWGLSAQTAGARRGLAPLTTNVGGPSLDAAGRRQGVSSNSTVNTTITSPFTSTFSSVLNSSSRTNTSRNASSTSSSASPFTPLQTGSQQPQTSQLLASPRSRANTPFNTSNLASSAAATTTISQGGGGGGSSGGGSSRPAAFSPSTYQQTLSSPTTASFDRTSFISPASASAPSGQSSVSKIVVTQVFLLLGSITEKEGKAKWDSQADAIRKLVDLNGMEVFSKYFRRLLVGNSPQIFPGINRNVENPANYQLLVQEMERITHDPEQAKKIAETIDTSEDVPIFRDFDISAFMNHFKLDPIAKTLLASAFTQVTRADLRTKAGLILYSNYQPMCHTFANLHNNEHDVPPSLLAAAAFRFLSDLPENFKEGTEKNRVYQAIQTRYSRQGLPIPAVIKSAMALVNVLESGHDLARGFQKKTPSITASIDTAKDALRKYSRADLDEEQISGVLLFMVLTPDWEQYRLGIFVAAIRELLGSGFDWQQVVRGFDREGIAISQDQFLVLYNALLPIAQDDPNFDIQGLWGGSWQNTTTQLSFVLALTSLSSSQLDATSIPGLRQAYDPNDCIDGPEEAVRLIDEAQRNTMISLDAVTAIFDIVWNADDPVSHEDAAAAKEVVGANMGFFLCSAAGISKPWTATQHSIMTKMVMSYILKEQLVDYHFVLHSLWKQDKQWLASRLIETHAEDPTKLTILLEHAQEHGWLQDLCSMMNGFGIDLAALAHRKGYIDIRHWAQDKLARGSTEFVVAITKFLVIKAQDEMRTVRREQMAPRTVNLAMKTVYAMLEILEEQMKERQEGLIPLERQCVQAFPRLINYGEGFDDLIEANGEEGNSFPEATDAEMQELYKRMYSGELEVRDIIETLRECKTSNDPSRQELFSCLIHGLFDEYVCFHEYPLQPLATTAVLFGGIISYNLISNFTLSVGLEMVLEAVRDYGLQESMYKFGLQALLNFRSRLHEFPNYCRQLIQIPDLQGTEVYSKVQQVLNDDPMNNPGEIDGMNSLRGGMELTNGDFDAFLPSDTNVRNFRSIHADRRADQGFSAEPEEEVQDKVLFVLNNVSEQNISSKVNDLSDALDSKHYQWLAQYLVDQRARLQPNYQLLYLEMLRLIGDRDLWAEVLHETFVSVQKSLNAESTMKGFTERVHLKNLGTWLGFLTVARDKPIKHKNLSFIDLLIEGWETQRLIVVIPFVCSVLKQGANSIVFKPPNPWVMQIIGVLMELYDIGDPDPPLPIQQKFEIEQLLETFGLITRDRVEIKDVIRSDELQRRRELYQPDMSDGNRGFEVSEIANHEPSRNARLSPATITSSIPDIENLLTFPPLSGSIATQTHVRRIVQDAIRRAIMEIVVPVVERSVTIATIATAELIHKDFTLEVDDERVRDAAKQMARSLSGSLALVTSKEPLRSQMNNNIHQVQQEVPDGALPEGTILMCVNDNLDAVCGIVERTAEEHSAAEIEVRIEADIELRRKHKMEYPNEPFRDPDWSVWSGYIPEPYKQAPGGLNPEQMEIYLHFARQSRGPPNHVQTSSTDSGRQIPDILQDPFPSVPNLSTPAEPPAIPHKPVQQQQQQQSLQGRMMPQSLPATRLQPHMNGYLDQRTIQEHIEQSVGDIGRLANEAPEERFKDLVRESPILEAFGRIRGLIMNANPHQEHLALSTASKVCQALYSHISNGLGIEVLVQLLHMLCRLSSSTAREVVMMFRTQAEDKFLDTILKAPMTIMLLETGLLEFSRVDIALAKALQQQNQAAIPCLSALLDALLFSDHPVALRADFASSLGMLGQWLSREPNLSSASEILSKLRAAGVPEDHSHDQGEPLLIKQHQMQYIFTEWLAMCNHPEAMDGMSVAFITQLHQRQLLNSQEDMVLFLRLCIDSAVDVFEQEEMNLTTDPNDAYFTVDVLARLVVLLVTNKGETNGAVKGSKPSYMRSILSLIILVLNNHHVVRGDQFNQRMFFRLFSSILYDWSEFGRSGDFRDKEMILVFADTLLLLEPRYFPAFTYGWLSLVSHRVFMPAILKVSDEEGCEPFAKIIEIMFSHISGLLEEDSVPGVAKEVYRGVLRILLILHHDFPEFLAENHYRFCNIIPTYCTQLRNLVLSAYPSLIPELPDPFTAGLKVDRLDEIRRAPTVAGDISEPLRHTNIKDVIDDALRGSSISDETINQITEAIYRVPSHLESSHPPSGINSSLLHAIVLYIGQTAISTTGSKAGPSFNPESYQASLLTKLTKELHPEARYYFLGSLVNQLRWPNSHTHYFSYALIHLFGSDHADQQESDVRQQIIRVLLERLIVHRPHPWGLIITLIELVKNPTYIFWELPFIKAAPEVRKLYEALFQLIHQSPRTLT